ncbi:MAG TPA: MgtC/SapB family protein [Thermoanaerobaculia bacterium]|nr:MgtC/SapB family protein [Thermoanaerobaculia bacterium]
MIDPVIAASRLALALAFGAIIGVEREWRMKQAGLKTMALVAVGAAAFAMMSDTFGPANHNPGQIAAAVVGGIGFIGAGVIMHRGLTVQGLTTAATLWADASVGVAIGLGQFALGSGLTIAIVITQIIGRRVEMRIRRVRRKALPGRFELRVECESESLRAVNDVWRACEAGEAIRTSVQRGPEALVVRVILRGQAGADLTPLTETLVTLPGVKRVDLRHLGTDEE